MDRRNIRIGDWVCDPSNFNYEMKVGLSEMQCAGLFMPVVIQGKFLDAFKREGERIWYRGEGERFVSLEDCGDRWRVSIHSENIKIEGSVRYMHELQHLLCGCNIHWI